MSRTGEACRYLTGVLCGKILTLHHAFELISHFHYISHKKTFALDAVGVACVVCCVRHDARAPDTIKGGGGRVMDGGGAADDAGSEEAGRLQGGTAINNDVACR